MFLKRSRIFATVGKVGNLFENFLFFNFVYLKCKTVPSFYYSHFLKEQNQKLKFRKEKIMNIKTATLCKN